MEELEVVFKEYGNRLNQIRQKVPIKFAFLTEKNEQCHDLVLCKDYLHDVLYSILGKRKINIYGFSFAPKDNPEIDLNNIRILVESPYGQKETEEIFKNSIELVHYYEKIGKIEQKTKIYSVKGKPEYNVFVGSKEWLSSPALISLYSLLIRLGKKGINTKDILASYEKILTGVRDNDVVYLERIYKYLEFMIEKRHELFKPNQDNFFEEYYGGKIIDGIHNSRGVMSFCMGSFAFMGLDRKTLENKLEEYNKEKEKEKEVNTKEKKEKDVDIIAQKEMIRITSERLPGIMKGNYIQFGLVSSPPERFLCSDMFTCRDYLNDYLCYIANNTPTNPTGIVMSKTKPDFEKLRMLIAGGNADTATDKIKIFFAKKLLNIIEKEIKLEKPSKITSVNLIHDKKEYKNYKFYLLTGPEEWMYSSHALSFVTFIFKSCFLTDIGLIKKHEEIATITDIKKYFKEVIVTPKQVGYSYSSPYLGQYLDLVDTNLDFIIENFKEIFVKRPIEERFPKNDVSVHGGWGIMSLMTLNATGNKIIVEKYKELKSEYTKKGVTARCQE